MNTWAGRGLRRHNQTETHRCGGAFFLVREHPSLPCEREGDRVSGGGIRGTWFGFAETRCEFPESYRESPEKQFIENCFSAPFDKGAMLGVTLSLYATS